MAVIVKISIILVLLMTIAGCRALSEAFEPDANAQTQDLPLVKREQPNLSSQPAEAAVDPDSDDLVEDPNPIPLTGNSNTTPAANNNASSNNEAKTGPETVQPGKNYVATMNGFGTVKTGMTVAQASQALGTELVRGAGYEDACYYVDAKDLPGVRLMAANGKITRIDISSDKYPTDKGAKVGDSEDKIKSLYQNVEVVPNKYDEKKHEMVVISGDEQYMLIFETDGSRVTGYRVGFTQEVLYVEGCS